MVGFKRKGSVNNLPLDRFERHRTVESHQKDSCFVFLLTMHAYLNFLSMHANLECFPMHAYVEFITYLI